MNDAQEVHVWKINFFTMKSQQNFSRLSLGLVKPFIMTLCYYFQK